MDAPDCSPPPCSSATCRQGQGSATKPAKPKPTSELHGHHTIVLESSTLPLLSTLPRSQPANQVETAYSSLWKTIVNILVVDGRILCRSRIFCRQNPGVRPENLIHWHPFSFWNIDRSFLSFLPCCCIVSCRVGTLQQKSLAGPEV